MKYDEKNHNFKSFIEDWSSDKTYLLFGKSKECYQFIRTMDQLLGEDTLKISGLMDFEQQSIQSDNSMFSVFPYYYHAKYKKQKELSNRKITLLPIDDNADLSKVKIIVTTDLYKQRAIDYLEKQGLKKDIDYCSYKKIAGIWPLLYKNMVHLFRVDQTLTTKCSLNCKYCNMFMPHYKKQANQSVNDLILDIDALFDKIDFTSTFHLVGGEPFLYPFLNDILMHLGKNYRDKIDNLIITSNGTISPKKVTLELMRKYNVFVSISDYTRSLPIISKKVNKVINKLSDSGVYNIVRKVNEWTDYGDPRSFKIEDEKDVIKHFDKCTAPYRGINKLKFYYCNLSMSADTSGIHHAQKGDYMHLDEISSKDEIIKFDLGYSKKGYVSLCKTCNGCNTGINIPVSPQEQGLRSI